MVDALGEKTLKRVFNGGKWHFVTVISRADSEVTRRLKCRFTINMINIYNFGVIFYSMQLL